MRVLGEQISTGRRLNHTELLVRIWGPAYAGGSGAARTTAKNLRDRLGDDAGDPKYIFADPKVEYRMTVSWRGAENGVSGVAIGSPSAQSAWRFTPDGGSPA